jgi:hypothetical protein
MAHDGLDGVLMPTRIEFHPSRINLISVALPPNTALYYAHTKIRTENLIKTALLLWGSR